MAAQRADPALLRNHDGDRLAHHHRLFDRGLVVLRRLGEIGAALAERRLLAELVAHLLDLAGDRLPLLLLGADQLLDVGLLLAQLLVLALDLHLLELAQVAQPHVEDGVGLHVGELERLHQDGLGLVLVADDLDDLVEVEIGDQEAAQHFEAMLDLAPAGAWSGGPAPRGGGRATRCSTSARPITLGTLPLDSTFMLSGMRLSSSVSLNSDSIRSSAIDRARLRLDDDAHVLGRLVAEFGDQRQLLVVEQLRHPLDQALSSAPATESR